MAISGTTTNYSGRKKDILIFSSITSQGVGAQKVDLSFGDISKVTAGVQKLVQRYIILFFTQLGSQPDFPEVGTNFLTNSIGGSGSPSQIRLRHLFNFANALVVKEMLLYQLTDEGAALPDDEKLAQAKLINLHSSGDTVRLEIAITTVAGDSITYLLPLPLDE